MSTWFLIRPFLKGVKLMLLLNVLLLNIVKNKNAFKKHFRTEYQVPKSFWVIREKKKNVSMFKTHIIEIIQKILKSV